MKEIRQNSLTENFQNDRVMPTVCQEVGKVRGSVREYRKGHFQVYFSYKGEKFYLYKYLDGTPLLHEFYAKRLLEHINSLIDSHKFDPSEWRTDKPYLFEKAIESWIDLSTCSAEWIAQRKRIAKKFLVPFFHGEDIRELRKIHIDRFYAHLKGQGYSDKYLYNLMGELKAFFHFTRESVPKIPSFPRITYQEPPIRWITEDSQNQVFEFIPEADRPIFDFMRWTGCRPNEAGGLLKQNVHLKHNPPYFVLATVLGGSGQVKPNTKTKKAKPLPIIPELEDALKSRDATTFAFARNGAPYRKKLLERIWNQANQEANKKYGTPLINLYNGLKHSFGCQRLNAGFSLGEIRAVYGYVDIRTTQKYAQYVTGKLGPVMRNVHPLSNATKKKKVVQR